MATPQQIASMRAMIPQARASRHIFPDFAVCEAALESRWFTSQLGEEYNNLFGQKCPVIGGVANPPAGVLKVTMATWEIVGGKREVVQAPFLWFPHVADCFNHRMALLEGAAHNYPDYAEALRAHTGEEFVIAVSRTWSTDPTRAAQVIEIHDAHRDLFSAVPGFLWVDGAVNGVGTLVQLAAWPGA